VLTRPGRRGGRWEVGEFLATGETEVEAVLARAAALGRPARHDRALDFGCGAGRLTRALAGRFEHAVGVDISSAMVDTARRLNGDVAGCEFVVNDRPDLELFGDGSFDLAYSSLVLQHLPGRRYVESYVRELLRVTVDGGVAVFGIPDTIAWPYRLGLSRRLYATLRRLGVPEHTLLTRTPLTPMRMTAVPERAVRAIVTGAGATVLDVEPLDEGAVQTKRYYVAPDTLAR
jgi:SAM-dependent methyltransferase